MFCMVLYLRQWIAVLRIRSSPWCGTRVHLCTLILHLIKVMQIYLRPLVHFEPPSLYCKHPRPSMAPSILSLHSSWRWGSGSDFLMRIWIQLLSLMRIRIRLPKTMRIRIRISNTGSRYPVFSTKKATTSFLTNSITVPKLENHCRFYILYSVRYAIC
jgi:hypothetical protein